jgi:hypothetical protein
MSYEISFSLPPKSMRDVPVTSEMYASVSMLRLSLGS